MSGTAFLAAMVIALGIGVAGSARAATGNGRAWLGIYMQELDQRLKDAYGRDGVLVSRVTSDSPAKTAGIQRGDLIIKVDGKPVTDSDDLSNAVEAHKVGEKVSVSLVRAGRERTIMATLAERPDDLDDTPSWGDGDDDSPVPYAPRAPRPPRAPHAPMVYDWSGDMGHLMALGNRGRLGVRIESLNDELGDYFKAPGGKGVLVLEVMDDTPAKDAGMKAGDVITKVDGTVIEDTDDLSRALRNTSGKVQIEVMRKGVRQVVTPTLRSMQSRSFSWSGDPNNRVYVRRSLSDSDEADLRREIEDLRRELNDLKKERQK
jgi:serine protease Do